MTKNAAAGDASATALLSRVSRLSGFYRLTIEERRDTLTRSGWLTPEGALSLSRHSGFQEPIANVMSENVIGIHGLPLGLGLNFRINGKDFLAPMAIEEPSVVAAASNAARLALAGGGFTADADLPLMIAQVELVDVPDFATASAALAKARPELIARANALIPDMVRRGGGVRDVEARLLEVTPAGAAMVVHLEVDTRDAMGANLLNTLAEEMAGPLQAHTGGRIGLRILSNLADRRRVRVLARLPIGALAGDGFDGEQVRDGIVRASRFAELDTYRACTHNKGIMNGVDAVVMATGNDWRAVEAGAHAWAARNGRYSPLATWRVDVRGDLLGELEMPLALGTVGGAARAHPGVRLALELSGVGSARELSMLAGAVGLASNLAALKALASTGIQKGHMTLHARSVAAEVGATDGEVARVALELAREGDYTPERARAVLNLHRAEGEVAAPVLNLLRGEVSASAPSPVTPPDSTATSELLHPLLRYHADIEAALRESVARMGEETPLRAACEHALLSGGKRLRPAIVLMVAEALGGRHPVMQAALATEFFHTASLIADDLPCMDDADERRDHPTTHRVYGEDVALLATFALIAEGYRFLAENTVALKRLQPDRPWERVGVAALDNATLNTGIRGMTGGQYLDLHPPADRAGALATLAHLKTTTLFEISFVLGWLFGGGDPDRLSSVQDLARDFGLAFQIADDLDDAEEDARTGRPNFALQFGVEGARERLRRAVDSCEALAGELGLAGEAFGQMSAGLRLMAGEG